MKVAGIIAEYNPFHNGHKYHIEETRKRTNADFIIAAISGDFVQRGAPAILDKYARTRMALSCGADLVFELPVATAISSAEGFAAGGIALLHSLGVVDAVSCGCESAGEEPAAFRELVDFLSQDFLRSPSFNEDGSVTEDSEIMAEYSRLLKDAQRDGMSFPAARAQAVREILGEKAADLLSHPNDILALEYAKAIKKCGGDMELCLIPRRGHAHHNEEIFDKSTVCDSQTADDCAKNSMDGNTPENFMPSATVIRKLLLSDAGDVLAALKAAVPAAVYPVLAEAKASHCLLGEDDFSDMLCHALIMRQNSLADFGRRSQGLALRTIKCVEQFTTWREFAALIKTKNVTYTAVSRYLTQIILNLDKLDMSVSREDPAPYARLLGFKRDATPLVSAIKEAATIPIVIQLADDTAHLPAPAAHQFQQTTRASELYRQVLYTKSGIITKPELRQGVITFS